jgi:hypothetical protein
MQRIGRLPPRNRLRHSKRAQPLWQWHQRLGHLNNADVKRLEAYNQDVKLSDGKERFCEPCTISKQHIIPSHIPQERAKAKFDRIHIDIAGGGATLPPAISNAIEDGEFDYKNADTPSLRGARYFMIITDDYSRYR